MKKILVTGGGSFLVNVLNRILISNNSRLSIFIAKKIQLVFLKIFWKYQC
jgi:hypothetical protein